MAKRVSAILFYFFHPGKKLKKKSWRSVILENLTEARGTCLLVKFIISYCEISQKDRKLVLILYNLLLHCYIRHIF